MGAKNRSSVRVVHRRGKKILVLDFRFRDKNGREQRCRRDATVQTMTAARAEAERLKQHAVEYGTVDPTPAAPTFEAFVRGRFIELALPGFRPATRERYRLLLFRDGIVEALANRRLDEIGMPEYRKLEARVRERGANPRPHLSLLRTVLRVAYELEEIPVVPRLPPLPPKQRKLTAAPPSAVVQALLDASTGWLRTAIGLAFFASQRSGEVRAARVMDVDFGSSLVFTRKAFSANEVVPPKSGDERAVPMAAPLRDILAEAVKGKKPTDRLVTDDLGRTPIRQAVYKAFVALQRRLGISPTWSFHRLRHAFGTHLVQLGANIEAVREMMGHADLATTSRYLHATSNDKVHAIGLLTGNWGATQ
jgi:integrase